MGGAHRKVVRLVRILICCTKIYNNLRCGKLFLKFSKIISEILRFLSFMSCQFGLFLRFFTFLSYFVKGGAFGCGKFARIPVVRLSVANMPHRTAWKMILSTSQKIFRQGKHSISQGRWSKKQNGDQNKGF